MKKIKTLKNTQESFRKLDAEAVRRADAFPVKGGDIVPIVRKSWYKTVEQKLQPAKVR